MRSVSHVSRSGGAGVLPHAVWLVIIAGLLLAGCELENSSGADSGTLTIRVTNVSSLDVTGQLTVGIYDAGAPGPPDVNGLLGIGVVNFDTSDVAELQVQSFDGLGPSGEPWIGEPGWDRYDLYVIVEPVAGNQLFDLPGEYANGHPGRSAINGDSVITFRYPDDFQTF